MLRRRPRARVLSVLLALLALAGGCKDGDGASTPETTRSTKPPLAYVAVGASETVGTGADNPAIQAWPRVLADKLGAGGRQVTFTNVGFGGASVPEMLASKGFLGVEALQPPPGLATVWLNANDIIREIIFPGGRPYEDSLDELVRRLRRGGATTVLVANTPALERLPLYLNCLTPERKGCPIPPIVREIPQPDAVIAKVGAYNQAIARVAERHGAVVVDLHAASLKARADGIDATLIAADGFHPSTAGHAAVAATFAEAADKAGV